MEKVWQELQNPVWWVSVFAAGLVVGVIGNLCTDMLGGWWSRRSEKARHGMTGEDGERRSRVADMASSFERLQLGTLDELRLRSHYTYVVVVIGVVSSASGTLSSWLGPSFSLLALVQASSALSPVPGSVAGGRRR